MDSNVYKQILVSLFKQGIFSSVPLMEATFHLPNHQPPRNSLGVWGLPPEKKLFKITLSRMLGNAPLHVGKHTFIMDVYYRMATMTLLSNLFCMNLIDTKL